MVNDGAAPQGPLRAQLLVAPHHGSHSSSSEELLDAVRPRRTSMQLGYRNHFGHHHPEVLQRYRDRGIAVLRSDEAGAVQWRVGAGGEVAIERWRRDHARYWHNQPAPSPGQMPSDVEESHE